MDNKDLGRIGSADRATHEPSQSTLSRPAVGIPCAKKRQHARREKGGRDATLTIWVTRQQREAFDIVAERCGLSRAEFLRLCVREGQRAAWQKHGLTEFDIRGIQIDAGKRVASAIEARQRQDSEAGLIGEADESAVPEGETPND